MCKPCGHGGCTNVMKRTPPPRTRLLHLALAPSRGGRMTDTGMLSGKVALVTAASRGIGPAAARLFAREGATVVLAARCLADRTGPSDDWPGSELRRSRLRWCEVANCSTGPRTARLDMASRFDASQVSKRARYSSRVGWQAVVFEHAAQVRDAIRRVQLDIISVIGIPRGPAYFDLSRP
jgi:short subunit dehydrogenase